MGTGVRATYLDVLRLPYVLRAFVPSVVGKLSFAMVSLALLLLVQEGPGGFALSGAIVGGFGLGNVVAAPLRARLVDQYGARLVLPWLAVGYAAGLIGVVFAVGTDSGGVAIVLGVLSGLCTPPLGAVMRGVWALLAPTDGHRTRAYGLDAVAEELVFIAGPLMVSLVVLLPHGPVVAVVVAATAGLVGTVGMVLSPVPKPGKVRRRASAWSGWVGPLRHARLWPVLSVLVGVGLVLGAVELLSTAHGQAMGHSGLAGVLLAFFAVGSAAGGLFYGSRTWTAAPMGRMVLLGLAACGALFATAWGGGLVVLVLLFTVVGLFVAPSMISGYLAADEIAPIEERTEASALINTAVNAGAALAFAVGGALLDSTSITVSTVLLAATAGIFVAVAVLSAVRDRRLQWAARATVAQEDRGERT
ncbi:MFS transporter [Nocardiopsis valliformis]|uniref:MFS transporter n=1 Tax=Nocardiopsis valliformis TaxID=239974 RepID=UPI00034D0D06|nr:MFS transporter [Nocardiopsis valliformis]